MPGSYRLKRSFKKFDRDIAKEVPQVPGNLGVRKGGGYVVEVPNRPGYFYVRLRGDLSELIMARNDATVAPFYDLPVLVSRKAHDPTQWYIVGRDAGRYQNWGSANYLPNHGPQHSFEPTNPGYDIVWVYGDQFMPMLGSPSGAAGSMSLTMYPSFYYVNGQLKYMGYTGTPDLTAYRPASGTNLARMVLIYGDANGNPGISVGNTFSSSVTGSRDIIPYIPAVSGQGIPAWAVRLDWDTTVLDWSNRFDVRPLYVAPTFSGSAGGGGGGGGIPTIGANEIAFSKANGQITGSYMMRAIQTYSPVAQDIGVYLGGGNPYDQDFYILNVLSDGYGSGTARENIAMWAFGDKPYFDSYMAWGSTFAPYNPSAGDNIREDWVYAFLTGTFVTPGFEQVGRTEWEMLENLIWAARGSKYTIFNFITGTSTAVPAVQIAGSWSKFNGLVSVPRDNAFMWGDHTVSGTWRQRIQADDSGIIWEQFISGTWITRTILGLGQPGSFTAPAKRIPYVGEDTFLTSSPFLLHNNSNGSVRSPTTAFGGQLKDATEKQYTVAIVDDTGGSGSSNSPLGIFSYGGSPLISFYSTGGSEGSGTKAQLAADNTVMVLDGYAGSNTNDYAWIGGIYLYNREPTTTGTVGSEWEFWNGRTGTATTGKSLVMGLDYAKFNGLVQIPATNKYYWGDISTTGSWRMGISGENIIWQKNVSGSWVTQTTIPPGSFAVGNTVKVSSADTSPDFLYNKISGSLGIQVSKVNAGANESLLLTNTASGSMAGLGVYEIPFAGYSGTTTHNPKFRYYEPGANGGTLIIGRAPNANDPYWQHGLDVMYDSATGTNGNGIGIWEAGSWGPTIEFTKGNGGFSGSSYGNYALNGDLLMGLYGYGVREYPAGKSQGGAIELYADADFQYTISGGTIVWPTSLWFSINRHDTGYSYNPLIITSKDMTIDTSLSVPVEFPHTTGYVLAGKFVYLCGNTTPIDLYLPAAAGAYGRLYTFKNVSGSAVAVVGYSGQLVEGSGTYHLLNKYDTLRIISDGTNWWSI